MLKRRIAFLASSCVALGALISLTSCGKKYDLVIYNWEDYIYEGTDDKDNQVDDSLVDKFVKYYEEKHGKTLSVAYETFSTNEEMYQQIKLGAVNPDVICPSDYMIQRMANEGLLEPFSYSEETKKYGESLTNWETYASPFIMSRFASEKLDDGKSFLSYSVPYFWGTVGFTYDPEKISEEEVSSWESLWNVAKYNKKFSLKDSVRDTYVPAIFHVYKDEIAALDENAADYNDKLNAIFNRCDDETLAKVEAALKEIKGKTVYGFEVDEGKDEIVKGTYWANLAWSGDAVYAMDAAEENETPKYLNYALPEEGSNVWFDGWCMPKGARKDVAEEFVNFICDPANAALCMDSVGYTSPVVGEDIWELVNDWYAADEDETEFDTVDLSFFFGDSIEGKAEINVPKAERGRQFDAQYPTEDALKRCCIMKDFGDQQEKVEAMWSRVKAA